MGIISKNTKMGFYYEEGFYYDQPQGFYYNQQQQQQKGFYYDNQGFYYEGFYYETPKQGFYYDQQDKFNKDNKDYWYKNGGKDRMIAAINGLRTMVDIHVTKNPHAATDAQGQALSNVCTVQVVREVIKKFVRNVNPEEYFKNGGNEKKLAVLLVKECQNVLGPEKDFRAKWREEGSKAKAAMDKVTNELIPFIVSWQSKQPFHPPNAVQDSACMKVVAARLVDEAFYEYAVKNNPSQISNDPKVQQKQTFQIAQSLVDAALGVVERELKA